MAWKNAMSPLSTHQPDMSIKLKLLNTTTQPVEIGDRERKGVEGVSS
jgi:hypothetical protein